MTAMKWKQVACVECPGLKQEITRLHAEVERLTQERQDWLTIMDKKERERDEALSEVKAALDLAELASEARDEALAQVAVLLREIYDWPHHEQTSEQARSVLKRLTAAARSLPTEARALLDRLQKVEKEADLAKRLVRRLPLCQDHRDKFPAEACLACRLQRAEALINVLKCKIGPSDSPELYAALATWEEGKA